MSGAHSTPAVSAVMVVCGELPSFELVPYVVAQRIGVEPGAWLAHAVFDMGILQLSTNVRSNAPK
ncbi:hypothetical protein [Ralstonia sp. UBA689]|uniref:hypothetical protein n=1 Tax=Ralstonia sp. UBA689 TaxID=1947373 RepID=UPI0039C91882